MTMPISIVCVQIDLPRAGGDLSRWWYLCRGRYCWNCDHRCCPVRHSVRSRRWLRSIRLHRCTHQGKQYGSESNSDTYEPFVGSCALDTSDDLTPATYCLIINTSCSENKRCLARVAEILQDGNLADGSRWQCSPSHGGDCTISYDLGAVRDLTELRIGRCLWSDESNSSCYLW